MATTPVAKQIILLLRKIGDVRNYRLFTEWTMEDQTLGKLGAALRTRRLMTHTSKERRRLAISFRRTSIFVLRCGFYITQKIGHFLVLTISKPNFTFFQLFSFVEISHLYINSIFVVRKYTYNSLKFVPCLLP